MHIIRLGGGGGGGGSVASLQMHVLTYKGASDALVYILSWWQFTFE